VERQLKLLQVPRSSHYYKPVVNFGRNFSDSYVEDAMKEIYKDCPFYGVPRLTHELHRRGYGVNHKRVRRLQREMGMRTIYPRPKFNTSVPAPENRKYPYLLRDLEIERPNQVWATDITYTAVEGKRAFVIAIIDLFSRRVMGYRTTNTMEASGCVEVLDSAMKRYGKPEIFNSDQGSQFTGREFTDVLAREGVRISMDGRGRCLDNAKMERFWWSLKYEDIKLKDYESLNALRLGVQSYVNFYNSRRNHTALPGFQTPDEVYFSGCNLQSKVV
jgi:putative transposase